MKFNVIVKKPVVFVSLVVALGAVGFTVRWAMVQSAEREAAQAAVDKLNAVVTEYDSKSAALFARFGSKEKPSLLEKKNLIEQLVNPLRKTLAEVKSQKKDGGIAADIATDAFKNKMADIALRVATCDGLLLAFNLSMKMDALHERMRAEHLSASQISNVIASEIFPPLQKSIGELKNQVGAAELSGKQQKAVADQAAALSRALTADVLHEMLGLEELSANATLKQDVKKYFALRKPSAQTSKNPSMAFLQGEFLTHVQETSNRLHAFEPYFSALTKKEVAPLQNQLVKARNILLLLTEGELDEADCHRFEDLKKRWLAHKLTNQQALALVAVKPTGPDLAPMLLEKRAPASRSISLQSKVHLFRVARENVYADLAKKLRTPKANLQSSFQDWANISQSPLKLSMRDSIRRLEQSASAVAGK